MKIVIIENEQLVAKDLSEIILKIDYKIQILAILYSIEEAIEWFRNNENPDIIFSEIKLGDGLSFEIFKKISCNAPIIFCTAYNEYALNAFKVNCIDYILKPFDKKIISDSINKYKMLKENLSNNIMKYDSILELFENKIAQKTNSILANYNGGIIPIYINEVALFYIENGTTYLITFDNKKYIVDKYLDEIKNITNNEFYRVNKQYLISRKIVEKVQKYSDNQFSIFLNVDFIEMVYIRKEKINHFYEWLQKNT